MRIRRITLEEVKNILNASDIESVKKWCNERRVEIMDEGFGEFVFDYRFEIACDSAYISKLLLNYEKDWLNEYNKIREHKDVILTKEELDAIKESYPLLASKAYKKTSVESSILKGVDKSVYTIKQAACAIKCCDKHIRNLIKSKRLKAEVINSGKKRNHYRISAIELDAYLNSKN